MELNTSGWTPWHRAGFWAREVLETLAGTDLGGQAGRFSYVRRLPSYVVFRPATTVHPDLRNQDATTIDYIGSTIINELKALSCKFQDELIGRHGLWTFRPEEIKYHDLTVFGSHTPQFGYAWRNIGGIGVLCSLSVRVGEPNSPSWVDVTYSRSWPYGHAGYLASSMALHDRSGRLPQKLERDQEEILGHQIPWEINYQEMAEKILDRSNLKDFTQALKGAGLRI